MTNPRPWTPLKIVRVIIFASVLCFGGLLIALRLLVPGAETSIAASSLGGDFTLGSSQGAISTRDFRGKVLLVYFGYTFCPDVCPTTLADVGQAFKKLSAEEQERVAGLFVSVDPERDSKARLAEYTAYFHPQIVGATGTKTELVEVLAKYGGTFQKRPLEDGEGYSMDHPGSLYVLAPTGDLYTVAHHGTTVDELVSIVRSALAGEPAPRQGDQKLCVDCT